MNNNPDYGNFNGLGNASPFAQLPIQTIPTKKKNKRWKENCMDALERIGLEQLEENIVFREARKMIEGHFTYQAVDIQSPMKLPWFDKEIRKLRKDNNIPTYIKHFDFIGIIVNAITGMYRDLDDRYRVESFDEYFTNEYIRTKTEMLHKYAQDVFKQEIDRMLLMRGIDPNKQDFQTEEEYNQYQQELQGQVKSLTPEEIEKHLSKNFKVLATEWAQNVLTADKKRFYLEEEDVEALTDYILTGRWFRHYRVGYDTYTIERWSPEETFFSQEVNTKFPQDGEYIGRVTSMTTSDLMKYFGHLMTPKQQDQIGDYWGQKDSFDENKGGTFVDNIFPQQRIVPFHNYYDHQINLQLEEALGIPLGEKLVLDENGNATKQNVYLPRQENDFNAYSSSVYSRYLRDDINVRRDTVRVTEGYWRSQKRVAILIYENHLGTVSVEIVTEDLLDEFLAEKEIKKLRNISIEELKTALKESDYSEYVNTITYYYIPEVWGGIKIRGNENTVKDDIYLKVEPLEYQIKGDAEETFQVKLPVAGIVAPSIVTKILPYQQLHNISMNQITELLEKELGVFFTFDITGLPSQYQDEDTEESIYRLRNTIKDVGLMPLDLSRQNTQGNQPNVFQRQEVVYATQVEYRWTLAQQYKQEAFNQLGITPQMLGQPNTYVTAEGVKQGAQASFALLNGIFDKFNTSKAKAMEVHLAIAQFCEVNGKGYSLITRKGDGELNFLNIMKEDGDIFPLRKLSVVPVASSKDAKITQAIQNMVMNDNTIEKDVADVIEIMTNPVIIELQQAAKDMRARKEKQAQEQKAFESEQIDKQIQANQEQQQLERDHEITITQMKIDGDIEESYINALGRAADKKSDNEGFERIQDAVKDARDQEFKTEELGLKKQDAQRKMESDSTSKAIELRKLALKAEEIKLAREKQKSQERISLYNKN